MIPALCVRRAETRGLSAIGEQLTFDFSSDMSGDASIQAYGVGLAGFRMDYEYEGGYANDAEKMGALGVSIVPNLVGNTVYATASAVMTDYGGDVGRGTGGYDYHPNCLVQATAVVLIGEPNPHHEVVLGNIFGLANGQQSGGITISDNALYGGFLAGFSLAASSPGSLSSLSCGVTDSDSQGQMSVTAAASASVGGVSVPGSVDVLVVSAPATVTTMVHLAPVTFGQPDHRDGMSGQFKATFPVPAGMKIVSFGLLQQNVNIVYSKGGQSFQLVGAYFSDLSCSGTVVSGTYTLNIFDPDFLAWTYIDASSAVNLYAIAQFASEAQR